MLLSIFNDMFIQNNIIPYKLTISMYQLVKVDCHNKQSDLQTENSYGIFLTLKNISLPS